MANEPELMINGVKVDESMAAAVRVAVLDRSLFEAASLLEEAYDQGVILMGRPPHLLTFTEQGVTAVYRMRIVSPAAISGVAFKGSILA